MSQMFGAAFRTAYGEKPNRIWTDAISKLSDDECRQGLTRLAREERKYPANLTEFVEACKPKIHGVRFLGVPQTGERFLLPVKRTEPERARQIYAELRERCKSSVVQIDPRWR